MAHFIFVIGLLLCFTFQEDSFVVKRNKMVDEQIIYRGIKDEVTLKALRKVPRHKFVSKSDVNQAYADRPIPIGYGQTISQPFIVAYMTEQLQLKPNYKVLEIGTGSGYQAAVLSEIVQEVHTIEIIEALGKQAKERLTNLGYHNVTVTIGDGYYGKPDIAPFDAIIVTAAAEYIPPPLIDQLKDGGKMIIPVGSPFLNQQLVMVEKKKGKAISRNLLPVRFVPFTRHQK